MFGIRIVRTQLLNNQEALIAGQTGMIGRLENRVNAKDKTINDLRDRLGLELDRKGKAEAEHDRVRGKNTDLQGRVDAVEQAIGEAEKERGEYKNMASATQRRLSEIGKLVHEEDDKAIFSAVQLVVGQLGNAPEPHNGIPCRRGVKGRQDRGGSGGTGQAPRRQGHAESETPGKGQGTRNRDGRGETGDGAYPRYPRHLRGRRRTGGRAQGGQERSARRRWPVRIGY